MGTASNPFANLSPVDAASILYGNLPQSAPNDFTDLFNDAAQACTVNVWNIFHIANNLKDQKNLQIQITNNSGGASDIEFAYMRLA